MTDQFDDFQINPATIGSDWVFTGQQATINRAPNSQLSNPQMHFVEERNSNDRTVIKFGYDHQENPPRTIGSGFSGHGVDWALYNYNPYGMAVLLDGTTPDQNPNFRVMNDWLLITGMGGLTVETMDVSDKKDIDPAGMIAYRNYPTEGYNSFGKKGDKEWSWQGNTWVPGN